MVGLLLSVSAVFITMTDLSSVSGVLVPSTTQGMKTPVCVLRQIRGLSRRRSRVIVLVLILGFAIDLII